MSDSDNASFASFGKLVPGFDFLQNLAKQAAGSAAQNIPQLPNLGNWVAPTLNVEELEKRIQELKAVQFWLDQNATALKATVQALEVQKMTLATLKGMNFNMGDVANAFKLKVADSVAGGVQRATDKAREFSGLEVPPTTFGTQAGRGKAKSSRAARPARAAAPSVAQSAAAGVVDPLQWWGSLTQQFQTIAADAMKDVAKKAAINTTRNVATGMAKDAMKTASGMARGMADSAGRSVADGARAAMNTALRTTQAWPTPNAAATGPAKSAARSPATTAAKSARAPGRKKTASGAPAKKAAPRRRASS